MDLRALQRDAVEKSKRWFPELYERLPRELVNHMTLGLAGEVGEAANIVKKLNRGVISGMAATAMEDLLRDELADVLIYLLLLAHATGTDLEDSVRAKQQTNEQRFGRPDR